MNASFGRVISSLCVRTHTHAVTFAARAARRMTTAVSADGAPLVKYEYSSAGIAEITMASPRNRNALSSAMIAALSHALIRAHAHDKAKVAVLLAEGPAFCAGHDLKEMQALQAASGRDGARMLFDACSDLMLQIMRAPMCVIAGVNGIATAAGCQLAASCDMVVAHKDARFATPGINIGLFCTTPSVALVRSVGRKVAAEMLFTGDMQSAEAMHRAGLVNYVTAEDARILALELAQKIASKPRAVLALGKTALFEQARLGSVEAAYEAAGATMCTNLLDEADAHEGIAAFLQKRTAAFKP